MLLLELETKDMESHLVPDPQDPKNRGNNGLLQDKPNHGDKMESDRIEKSKG